MDNFFDKGLVSIIMLSHGDSTHVVETVKSILAQTYQNWELLFVAKTDDESLKPFSLLREEDIKIQRRAGKELTTSYSNSRIKVSYIVGEDNDTPRRNSALANVQGRWIAFLDAGDIWEPTKLEKQIGFMEEHGYAFSYTGYGIMNIRSQNRGVVVKGKEHVTHEDMLKCCWPAYLTVMYDAEKVGQMTVAAPKNNDYALWLNVSDMHDCHLLDENLATMRTKWKSLLGKILLTNSIKWRYDAYRFDEGLGPITSFLYTIRNGWYGIVKWMMYVKR